MRASTFLVLLGVAPSLENVPVTVAMVSLVLVASHTYVILVHKNITSVSLYNYLHITIYLLILSSSSCTLPYFGKSAAGCITWVVHISGLVVPTFSSQVPAKTKNSLATAQRTNAWVAVIMYS